MAAWKDFIFLEIKAPFLSTISLLNNENFFGIFSCTFNSILFSDTWIILILNITIKEKNKKNNKYILS